MTQSSWKLVGDAVGPLLNVVHSVHHCHRRGRTARAPGPSNSWPTQTRLSHARMCSLNTRRGRRSRVHAQDSAHASTTVKTSPCSISRSTAPHPTSDRARCRNEALAGDTCATTSSGHASVGMLWDTSWQHQVSCESSKDSAVSFTTRQAGGRGAGRRSRRKHHSRPPPPPAANNRGCPPVARAARAAHHGSTHPSRARPSNMDSRKTRQSLSH